MQIYELPFECANKKILSFLNFFCESVLFKYKVKLIKSITAMNQYVSAASIFAPSTQSENRSINSVSPNQAELRSEYWTA